MSRTYEMRVMVRRYNPRRLGDICGALHAQWNFDPSDFPVRGKTPPAELDITGVDNIYTGPQASEMASRLAHAVWHANGAYCEVEVWSRFLDVAPPQDVHTWTADDHRAWLAAGGPESDEHDGQAVALVAGAET